MLGTNAPASLLEIDLLKTEIQKDLLSISALRVEEAYIKLFETTDPKDVMQKKGKAIFLQCIKKSCDFLHVVTSK